MTTCALSDRQLCLPWISSAEASHAKTFPVPASELASEALAAACGLSSVESFRSFARSGWWSKMSAAERVRGLTRSLGSWDSSGMESYRYRWRQRMSVLRMRAPESSSSLFPTLTSAGNPLSPCMQKWPAHRLLPTLKARDERSPGGEAESRRNTPDLPTLVGSPLSPVWCEWFMGFPAGWTLPVREYARLATRSCRSAPK